MDAIGTNDPINRSQAKRRTGRESPRLDISRARPAIIPPTLMVGTARKISMYPCGEGLAQTKIAMPMQKMATPPPRRNQLPGDKRPTRCSSLPCVIVGHTA